MEAADLSMTAARLDMAGHRSGVADDVQVDAHPQQAGPGQFLVDDVSEEFGPFLCFDWRLITAGCFISVTVEPDGGIGPDVVVVPPRIVPG